MTEINIEDIVEKFSNFVESRLYDIVCQPYQYILTPNPPREHLLREIASAETVIKVRAAEFYHFYMAQKENSNLSEEEYLHTKNSFVNKILSKVSSNFSELDSIEEKELSELAKETATFANTLNQIFENFEREMYESSFRDYVTGAYNSKYINERLEEKLNIKKGRKRNTDKLKERQNFVYVVVDLNELKKINDTLGHPAGDFYLRTFYEVLSENFRSGDIIGRLGEDSDEFVIIMGNQNTEPIAKYFREGFYEKIRSETEKRFKEGLGARRLEYSDEVYFGIGIVSSEGTDNIETLRNNAEKAMMLSKNISKLGKNPEEKAAKQLRRILEEKEVLKSGEAISSTHIVQIYNPSFDGEGGLYELNSSIIFNRR